MMRSIGITSRAGVLGTWPSMTSNTLPAGYVMTASSEFAGVYYAYQAHDGTAAEWVASSQDEAWLKIQFPQPFRANSVSINAPYGSSFVLSGSNDDSLWTSLCSAPIGLNITIGSPDFYRYYKLDLPYSEFNPRVTNWSMSFI
jgi:hypothetical protein